MDGWKRCTLNECTEKKKETIDPIDRSNKGKKERVNKWRKKITHTNPSTSRRVKRSDHELMITSVCSLIRSIRSNLDHITAWNCQRTGFSSLFTHVFANAYSYPNNIVAASPSSSLSSSSCMCKCICCRPSSFLLLLVIRFFCSRKVRSHTRQCPP